VEWNNAAERLRVAVHCDTQGAGYAPLAAVMRGRDNCSSLRKGHLLHLARKWGYASHLWCVCSLLVALASHHTVCGAEHSCSLALLLPPRRRKRTDPSQHAPPANGMQARVAAAAAALDLDAAAGWQHAGSSASRLPLPRLPGHVSSIVFGPPPPASPAPAHAAAPPPAAIFDPFSDLALHCVGRSTHAGAVAAHVRFVLTPLALQSAQLFGGDEAAFAAGSAGTALERRHLNAELLSEVGLGVDATMRLAAALATMRRAAFDGAARATSDAGAAGVPPSPAWRAMLGREPPWEAAIRSLVTRFGAGAAYSRDRAGAAGAPLPLALTQPEAVWLDEMYRGQLSGLELVTQTQIVLNELKLVPLDEFLECMGTLLELLRAYSTDCASRFTARRAWIERLMPAPDGEEPRPVLYRFFGRQESEAMPVRLVADDEVASASAAGGSA
jgi:hypothetical protein